ncbi:hypothetical protein QBC37DRAFT_444662 [Rhypophila decipiens]|uniref:Protein kinase domain-containing protein n=1 Tax=Rhypophila decipiens TaxID=261697 RepID=A0AAN6XUK2_9PEZI|nr:hypothetical protein QBC37DRAFT_444662 [Rhypophila decipiens]
MSSEVDIIRSYQNNIGDYFSQRNVYSRVYALLIYWADNDLNPEKEVTALSNLFRTGFGYETDSLKLPATDSLSVLVTRIVDVLREHSAKDSLLIVYYAGHCSPDDVGHARWTAYEKNGPSLSWHTAQQLLFSAEGDVLLLLDCCNAASIAKGAKETGRFEMIAACAKNALAVPPSRSSFTRNAIIAQTPAFHDFAKRSATKIWLQKLKEPQSLSFIPKPSSYMVMLVSLADDLTGQEMAEWLKAAAPKNVTAVEIEALVLRARRLEGLREQVFAPGSMLGKLSSSAKAEILRALQTLHTTMAVTSQHAKEPIAETGMTQLAEEAIEHIQSSVVAVCDALETPLLQDPGPASDLKAALDESNPTGILAVTNVAETLKLRTAVQDNQPQTEGTEMARNRFQFKKDSFQRKIATMDKQQPVILEAFSYHANPSTGDIYPETMQQIRKMSGLVSLAKRVNFRTLPCLGFFHDKVRHELGLVFEPPPRFEISSGLTTLLQLYTRHIAVPLGHRIYLAYALADSVDHFHRVGWVHKGIRSNNVLFFQTVSIVPGDNSEDSNNGSKKDTVASIAGLPLARPLLFGFEYSRAGDAGTILEEDYSQENNLYRHPDRWGRPLVRFDKSHDIYALGIVLFEIARWKAIGDVCGGRSASTSVKSTDIREAVKKKCQSELPHRVGEVLTQVILTCLDFGRLTQTMNEYDSQVYFQRHVTDRIAKGLGNV